jgi:Flp pilus assembly protein TadD
VGKPAAARIQEVDFGDRARELTVRAMRSRRKGDLRRAVVTLREACALDETDAARWVLFGHLLFRSGKRDEAAYALKQALFLRDRRGERAKANVIRRLILNLAATRHS